jgi:phosphomannomutase
MHQLNPSILRAYDIRGIMNETFFEEDAYYIGRAFATIVASRLRTVTPIIAIGCDGRKSSPGLKQRLSEGLQESGAIVYDVGCGPTPMVYTAVKELKTDAGMMITGSHNPPHHNGCKMMLRTGPFYGDDVLELGEVVRQGAFATGKGQLEQHNIYDRYVQRLADALQGSKLSLNVGWDAGNGATGDALQQLLTKLPGKHVLLNEVIDGNFPAHHPDPSVLENMQQLIDTVQSQKLDLGIAFDGDGDRIGVIDHMGRMIDGDHLVAILAQDVLHQHPGAKIIVDIKTGEPVLDYIAQQGGEPILWKSGHSLIKAKMIETNAQMAGEVSGHIFFADNHNFDDGLYAAVRLLNLLERTDKKLADFVNDLPKAYSTPEIRLEVPEERKFAVVEAIKARLKREQVNFNDIDGIRAKTNEGWWLLRASNTQAVLVIRCEAPTAQGLKNLVKQCEDYLHAEKIQVRL